MEPACFIHYLVVVGTACRFHLFKIFVVKERPKILAHSKTPDELFNHLPVSNLWLIKFMVVSFYIPIIADE
jgi:hypothetical protein